MADLEKLKYTKTHEWIRVEGNKGVVGITDHAQQEISDVVFVEVPALGKTVGAGEEAAVVESVKSAFSIYAPVAGKVARANEELAKNPGRVNAAPYAEGWIFELEGIDAGNLEGLMDLPQYEQFVQGKEA
ncbi:MAG: glycine cleavage system protein H [Candidatus Omnitrophica bacterium CG11_big_fil_rev_8_21_14_0_20_64_10]|nr:MAG: glycine cleavage system protein H [Candidatus Omnitrophica bacterium CG11_big_fil_rev_8_21_14_0_20_64_10]